VFAVLFAPIPTIPPPPVTDVLTPEDPPPAPAEPPDTGPLFPVTVPVFCDKIYTYHQMSFMEALLASSQLALYY